MNASRDSAESLKAAPTASRHARFADNSHPPHQPDVSLPGAHRYVLEADEHEVL